MGMIELFGMWGPRRPTACVYAFHCGGGEEGASRIASRPVTATAPTPSHITNREVRVAPARSPER